MTHLNWTNCLWPEDDHPMPLCRHVWERHLREQNGGELPVSNGVLDKQWDLIMKLQGEEQCPCAEEIEELARGNDASE